MTGDDRRTFLRRAGLVGVAAWTAPVILDSVASPAAAASIGASATGEVVTQTSNTPNTNLQPTADFSRAVTSGQVLLVLVAASWSNDGSSSRALVLSGPCNSATAIGTNAASNQPWIQYGSGTKASHHLYAYWALGNNTTTGVTASFTTAPDFAAVVAVVVDGLTTSGPASKFSRAADTSSPYGNPRFNLASTFTAGRAKLCVGAAPDPGGTVSFATPSGFAELAQISAVSGSSNGNLELAVFVGPSATNTSAPGSPGAPWGTITCELG